MTPQQQALRAAADQFIAAIERYIPRTTIHWAVEDARNRALTLSRSATQVITFDAVTR